MLIGQQWVQGHLIVAPDRIVRGWNVSEPARLEIGDLEPAIALEPEIVLLGTGVETPVPDTRLMASFAERGIGLEIMSTPAACRTFNVLVHEGRRVVAALFNAAGA